MKERKISIDGIVETVESPEEVTPSIKGRLNYCKTVGGKRIKVTCRENPGEKFVVTVIEKNS
jgi:hypothetical protein